MASKILIVAGEASADLHASNLLKKLGELEPGIQCYGVGSEQLEKAGARILFDFSKQSVVGVLEAAPKLKFFLKARAQLLQSIASEKPDLVLLLDLPDFNLRLAPKIKQQYPGQKIVYYISPQVWAWRKGRVKTIKKYVDLMLVILPFEEQFYEEAGVPVKFVGHPLVPVVKPSKTREELRRDFKVAGNETMLAFLPGSRKEELGHYVAPAFQAFARLQAEFPLKIFFALAPTLHEKLVNEYRERYPAQIEIVRGRTYDLLFASDLGLLGSGTATLEAALAELPMLILGKLKKLNYYLVKPFTYVNRVGLPNFIAGRDIVPELLMSEVNPERIYQELAKLIRSEDLRRQMKAEFRQLRERLGERDASLEAAKSILEIIHS